jgi:hypothetical protein
MAESKALARIDPQALLTKAVEGNASIEVLERLVALAKDVREVQAREEWHEAMAEFHQRVPCIRKTRTAKIATRTGAGYTYAYAPLSEIMETIRPVLGDLGLSVSWTSRIEAKQVVVICRISHSLGHVETSGEVSMPIGEATDGTGANPAQKVGISLTYAKRYSLLSIAGLAPDEDSDGAGEKSPRQEPMSRAQAATSRVVEPEVMPENDADLQAEARAREQAEAAQTQVPGQPKIDRGMIWNAVLKRAKTQGVPASAVLKDLAGKHNLSELTDAEVLALAKKLES